MHGASDNSSNQGSAWVLGLVGLALIALLVAFVTTRDETPAFDPGFDDIGPAIEDGPAEVETVKTPLVDTPQTDTGSTRDSKAGPTRTSGVLRGNVEIPEALRYEIGVWAVHVEEAINDASPRAKTTARRFRRRFELEPGVRVARFRIDDLPFSEYGWRVAAQCLEPAASSEAALVVLDARRPEADVRLKLVASPSVHFTVKDQERKSLKDVRVTIRPVGFPPQRKTLTKKTGFYGLAILEHVAIGDYELRIGPVARPLVPPKRVTVRGKDMQFEPIVVPKGGHLSLMITTTAGAGVGDCEVVAIAKDSKLYKRYEAKTDKSGRAEIEHIPPGMYWVNLMKKGFERGFEKIEIEDGQKVEKRLTLQWDFRR